MSGQRNRNRCMGSVFIEIKKRTCYDKVRFSYGLLYEFVEICVCKGNMITWCNFVCYFSCNTFLMT